ncbi:unnamed protein product [Adineta steineri]|uniref:ABC transporter domain-containing protein n=1 Tax=Adineta steineri TaxID=433720 RepID=A0A814TJS9_9BILA|nr:unnamed protein product [Adineta steineri]CAF1163008.1 unnamed protein product [Adineta steineri]
MNEPKNNFRNYPINTLGDYIRQNNSAWRTHNYPNKQHDLDWYRYLRQQANLPVQHDVLYGKRRKSKVQSQTQGTVVYDDDDDLGISKINFTSPPVTLTWLDLKAKAPPEDKGIKRTITKALCPWKAVSQSTMLLEGVSGIAKPGQLVAIMGASGAGKTTLLNILTNRRPGTLKIEGEVRVNGTNMGRNINRVSGYVQQEELFIPSMTTREHLHFHAMLRLNHDISKDQRIARIDEMLDLFNLNKVENTVIGQPGLIKGLSGGEKRRLLFASEVMIDPPLLFADEPTSGLDGSMAFTICDAMRKLCNQGKTIVCTIHQPSSEIFQLFDTLYLLAEGRVAYFGSRKKAQEFFNTLGFEAPNNYNLSDFYIQTLSILPFDKEKSLERIQNICDTYERSSFNIQYIDEIQKYHSIDDDQPNRIFDHSSKYKTNIFNQFRWLLWRLLIDMFRNPFEFRLRILVSIILGLILGFSFLNLKYDQTASQNMSSVLFLMILDVTFMVVQRNADSMSRQSPLFFKEHDDGIYRTIPYYISKVIVELPITAIDIFLSITIIYWMANLYNSARRFFILQGILLLCMLVSMSVGTLIGVSSPTPTVASALVVPILIPLLVASGFYIKTNSIPKWLIWLHYISWPYYTDELLSINQWADVKSFDCNPMGNTTCLRNGDDVLAYYNFKKSNYNRNIGLLVLLFGVGQLLSILILLLRTKFQRKTL